MDTASLAAELLVTGADEYAPRNLGGGAVHLKELRLFVRVRQVQAMEHGFLALFISEVDASAREGQPGITITCVGMGPDMEAAVRDAVGQWALGVLPVLAHWRGKHSCLSSPRPLETRGGRFTVLTGPLVLRGQPDSEPGPPEGGPFWGPLEPALRIRPLAQRVHWLELFASKSGDSVDATCRLNNRDWAAGQKVLVEVASAWEPSDEPLRTGRQFALLVPLAGNVDEIKPPSFWDRLWGRA
jgi:Family of unknown function (DUF6348)